MLVFKFFVYFGFYMEKLIRKRPQNSTKLDLSRFLYHIILCFYCLLLLSFSFLESFKYFNFVKGLFFKTTIFGEEHLWFVGYILLCDVLTPLLNDYRGRYIKAL